MNRLIPIAAAILALAPARAASPIRPEDRARAEHLVSQMTLEEKCRMISGQNDGFHTLGVERLGIRPVLLADATMGVRNIGAVNQWSTSYPAGIAMAATFNRELARECGENVAMDCKARGVGILLGPGVNIYRNALCGRNFEYMGEDPYLSGELAAGYIEGIQENGVIATVKHFALNNQEYDRHMTDSKADERTMNEIYFPAFRKAIEKGNVCAVMTSYNRVNGVHASENLPLQQNLRDWGFDGIMMSDWSSTYSTLRCAGSELDIEFPGNQCFTPERLMSYIERGIITEKTIDRKCIHILQTLSAFGLLDKDIKDENIPLDRQESHEASLRAARESIVLLKNDGILPLDKDRRKTIIITGPNSDRYTLGGGSSMVFPVPGRAVTFAEAMSGLRNCNVVCRQSPSAKEMQEAAAVIACVGYDYDTESESMDRPYNVRVKKPRSLDYECLNAVSQYASRFVIVVNSGGELDLSPWQDKASAIVLSWYNGEAAGEALADVVTGKVSPSGRLPFTWWGSLKDNPSHEYYKNMVISKRPVAVMNTMVEYGEGIFVGYRGIGRFGNSALYPFGYGLSYSKFSYSAPEATTGRDGSVNLSFTMTNTGNCTASEVAQVYVEPVNPSVPRPTRELKGFEKVELKKGESRQISIILPPDSFAYYDSDRHEWVTEPGEYRIQLCSDAMTIITETSVTIKPGLYDVKEYGAAGDGRTKDTKAIQAAIDDASSNGGGTVDFPAGVYVSGYLMLRSNVSVHLGEGAVLKASPDSCDYSPVDICPQNHPVVNDNSYGGHFILCIGQENVSISGPGTIDGNSPVFTYTAEGKAYGAKKDLPWRPGQMIYCVESRNLSFDGISLVDSPYWNLYLYGCTDVRIEGLDIESRRMPVSWNGDGIDIDCCRNVTVRNCRIRTNDDCIAIRSDRRWLTKPQDCSMISVSGCDLSSLTSAVRLGVGNGAIRGVDLSSLNIHGTRSAFSFTAGWSSRTRGVDISDVSIRDVTVDTTVIFLQMYPKMAKPSVSTRGVSFSNIRAKVELTSQMYGHPETHYSDICFRDVCMNMPIDTCNVDRISVNGDGVRFVSLSPASREELERNYQIRKSEVKQKGF